MKKAGIVGGITHRKGQWETERAPSKPAGKPTEKKKGHSLVLSLPVQMQMAKDKATGMSDKALAEKYSISIGYVHNALSTLFVKNSTARDILKNVLAENAIACGMRVRETVGELQPMQAAIATGIMTRNFIDLDKHSATIPTDVDFTELAGISELLSSLRGHVATPSDKEGDIIDISGESVVIEE